MLIAPYGISHSSSFTSDTLYPKGEMILLIFLEYITLVQNKYINKSASFL